MILSSGKLTSPGAASPHLCSLQGKRIAWANESVRGAHFDIGQVKFLTGGGAITARQLYGREYLFEPSHLLVLLTNHKPHADASDRAFWDRLCPILFNLRFVETPTRPNERQRDTRLLETLRQEASGILAWLLRGCLAWQREGLTIPHAILRERATYREEEDILGDFLQSCCLPQPGASIRGSQLYARYKDWCEENGLKYLNGRLFGMEMKRRLGSAHTRQGIVYLQMALLAWEGERDECVKGNNQTNISPNSACGADLGNITPPSCEGTEAIFTNFSSNDSPKFSEESYREKFVKNAFVPSHQPTSEEEEYGMSHTEEPI